MTQDLCPMMMPFDHTLVCFASMTARPLLLWCWLLIEMRNLPPLSVRLDATFREESPTS
jgi:hypothetical protein